MGGATAGDFELKHEIVRMPDDPDEALALLVKSMATSCIDQFRHGTPAGSAALAEAVHREWMPAARVVIMAMVDREVGRQLGIWAP